MPQTKKSIENKESIQTAKVQILWSKRMYSNNLDNNYFSQINAFILFEFKWMKQPLQTVAFINFVKKRMKTTMQKKKKNSFPYQGLTGHFLSFPLWQPHAWFKKCQFYIFLGAQPTSSVYYLQLHFFSAFLEKEMGCLRLHKCSFISRAKKNK